MSLPDKWIEKIFHRLTVAYGRDFLGRWEGIPVADVKADWAACLAGFEANPGAISYALDNLPDSKPPTAQDFRAICYRAPAAGTPRLDAPAANPREIADTLDKLRGVRLAVNAAKPVGNKDWAVRHKEAEARGVVLTPFVRTAYRQALGMVV